MLLARLLETKGEAMIMEQEDIHTKQDFVTYCRERAKRIYVREQVNDQWGSFNLEELPEATANKHIERLWEENRLPVLLSEELIE